MPTAQIVLTVSDALPATVDSAMIPVMPMDALRGISYRRVPLVSGISYSLQGSMK